MILGIPEPYTLRPPCSFHFNDLYVKIHFFSILLHAVGLKMFRVINSNEYYKLLLSDID
jgi:hypothetical protein